MKPLYEIYLERAIRAGDDTRPIVLAMQLGGMTAEQATRELHRVRCAVRAERVTPREGL
jgi:hypothetical protein